MPKIRWYHFFFLLAIFDVAVIALTLRQQQKAVNWVADLVAEEHKLDDQAKWIQRAQLYISELNAPGNDLFQTTGPDEYERQQRRLEQASQNMATLIASAPENRIDAGMLATEAALLRAEAKEIFRLFQPTDKKAITEAEQAELITKAGPAMARMDAAQHRALRDLGVINRRFAQSRVDLIERCEADINRHYVSQSFVFGAILLILLGAFLFGRRLSAADRALEEERGRVKEMRRERLAAIGELCSSVAHGIRNPLAAIRSSAQLALELGQLDRGSQERIQDILDEGQRLGDRVTGLLSMARATSDSFAPVDLNSVVDVSAKSLLPEIERLGLALDLELSDEPVTAEGDRARLEQCIVELLSNAMEHSPADGTILVRCYRDKKNVVVEVEDEGPGVSAPVRERVFDLFFTTKPAGTGIGLATVRRIARLHGGDATLDEVSAGGARFVVRLPRASVRSNEKSAGFRAA